MADEEEEAVRLQREQAAALRPEDYGLSESEGEEESSEEEGEEMGQWKRLAGCLLLRLCCCWLSAAK